MLGSRIIATIIIIYLVIPDRKVDGDHWEWKETARWVKFEEDVEEVNIGIIIIITRPMPAFGRLGLIWPAGPNFRFF